MTLAAVSLLMKLLTLEGIPSPSSLVTVTASLRPFGGLRYTARLLASLANVAYIAKDANGFPKVPLQLTSFKGSSLHKQHSSQVFYSSAKLMYLAANVVTSLACGRRMRLQLMAVIHTGYSSNGYGKKKSDFLVTKEVLELYKRNTTTNTSKKEESK